MERQLRAEEVESNGLCWEWKLKAEVVELALFRAAAQSRSGGFCGVRSGSSELK